LRWGIFGKLTAYDLIQVDDSHRSLGLAKLLQGFKATSPSNEASILIHDRQMQEANLVNALRQSLDVAQVSTVTGTDHDVRKSHGAINRWRSLHLGAYVVHRPPRAGSRLVVAVASSRRCFSTCSIYRSYASPAVCRQQEGLALSRLSAHARPWTKSQIALRPHQAATGGP
jgi:hypothetical protein